MNIAGEIFGICAGNLAGVANRLRHLNDQFQMLAIKRVNALAGSRARVCHGPILSN